MPLAFLINCKLPEHKYPLIACCQSDPNHSSIGSDAYSVCCAQQRVSTAAGVLHLLGRIAYAIGYSKGGEYKIAHCSFYYKKA